MKLKIILGYRLYHLILGISFNNNIRYVIRGHEIYNRKIFIYDSSIESKLPENNFKNPNVLELIKNSEYSIDSLSKIAVISEPVSLNLSKN